MLYMTVTLLFGSRAEHNSLWETAPHSQLWGQIIERAPTHVVWMKNSGFTIEYSVGTIFWTKPGQYLEGMRVSLKWLTFTWSHKGNIFSSMHVFAPIGASKTHEFCFEDSINRFNANCPCKLQYVIIWWRTASNTPLKPNCLTTFSRYFIRTIPRNKTLCSGIERK